MQTQTSLAESTRDFLAAYGANTPVADLPSESYELLSEWLQTLHGGKNTAEELVARYEGLTLVRAMEQEMAIMLKQAVTDATREAAEVAATIV